MNRILKFIATLCLITPCATAQITPDVTITNPEYMDLSGFGSSVAAIGTNKVVVGAPGHDP